MKGILDKMPIIRFIKRNKKEVEIFDKRVWVLKRRVEGKGLRERQPWIPPQQNGYMRVGQGTPYKDAVVRKTDNSAWSYGMY